MADFLPEMYGPKMLALANDLQRRFAWHMACGALNATQAAQDAGYWNASEAGKVRGHELMQNPKVLDAIEEVGRNVLRGLGPLAIRAARAILMQPKHRAHARMIEAVMDRAGYAAQTEHKVTVEHKVDTREIEELARRLAL